MARMSQKELLNDGIGSFLRKGLAGAARVAGGAIGALNTGAQMGVNATVGGMIGGAKTGYAKEKEKQKRGKSKWVKLQDYVMDSLNLFPVGGWENPKSLLQHPKRATTAIWVADLNWDPKTGEPKEGNRKYDAKTPLIVKWDGDEKSYSMVTRPRGYRGKVKKKKKKKQKATQKPTPTTGPAPGPTPTPGVVTSSTCQKDLLRQLQLLSK